MACLCIAGCSVNGLCPEHGDRMAQLDRAAEHAYRAFCESPDPPYRLPRTVEWADLPEVVKKAWRAAAAAARKD